MDAEPNVVQTGNQDVPNLKGAIQFENVSFRYAENEPVLSEFSVSIQPGENLAIVGHTGAGKSSLARLIARFYEFQSGRILPAAGARGRAGDRDGGRAGSPSDGPLLSDAASICNSIAVNWASSRKSHFFFQGRWLKTSAMPSRMLAMQRSNP